MEELARFFIVATVFVQSTSICGTSAEQQDEDKPKADKLTINIDSVSQRMPPQITYFIPDSVFNRTFNFNRNRPQPQPQPPIINMWPPDDSQMNHTFNNINMTDLMMSQQRAHRYIAVPRSQIRSDVEDDSATAFQNFNYQIDFAQIPDKKPDFTRFESLNREREKVMVKRVKPKKYTSRPVSTNYANTSPNIRSRIKYIKIDHENKFEVSKDRHQQHSGGGGSGSSISDSGIYSDELENIDTSDQSKVYNYNAKLKKSRRKNPKLKHYSMFKLSHPTTSSVENESSGYNFDNINTDEIDTFHSDHSNHKNCNHPNSDLTEQQPENEGNGNVNSNFGGVENKVINKHPRGFSIYLTKVIKHPKPYRALRMDKSKDIGNGFVPTRIMSSVRGFKKIVHKPRKIHKPTMRERLHESGGHVVYTEDGYEDKVYDHGAEDKSLEYLSRSRRSTNFKELKGQELIDHLDGLIKNVSDYLNSSEIIPDTHSSKYPLYNTSDDSIDDSPIKYSEYAKPVVDEDYSSELYESKTDECEEINEQIDLSNAHNDTSGPKKRLGNLGNKIDCLKQKLFGKQPLDNPLFKEQKISQPKPDKIFANIMQEADSIQAISEIVHSDVMDNIKFNENQRIFSDYGVNDNFAQPSYNTKSITAKPVNELNTNEKYSDDYKQRNNINERPSTTQKPYVFINPFNDPAQLPILDISKFIPTPKYAPTESDEIPLQTDFVPIVSPYGPNYDQQPTLTTTPTSAIATSSFVPPTQPPPQKYGPPILGSGQGHPLRKVPYYINQNANTLRTPTQNILLFKHRRPVAVAVVRYIPKGHVQPRP